MKMNLLVVVFTLMTGLVISKGSSHSGPFTLFIFHGLETPSETPMSYCLSDIRRAYDYLLSPRVGNSTTSRAGEHKQECEEREVFN